MGRGLWRGRIIGRKQAPVSSQPGSHPNDEDLTLGIPAATPTTKTCRWGPRQPPQRRGPVVGDPGRERGTKGTRRPKRTAGELTGRRMTGRDRATHGRRSVRGRARLRKMPLGFGGRWVLAGQGSLRLKNRDSRMQNRCDSSSFEAGYAGLATSLRAASAIGRRVIPANNMLIPIRVPMAHSLLEGQLRPIIAPRIRAMTPSKKSQREPER